jgi:transcription elongation factor/antiterminator RfaH
MPFGWYAIYTRHQHEKSAADLLARKGFEVLLPLYRSRSRWTDRTRVVHLPLFPNYLFVRADLERRVHVLRTAGVCWFVENGGRPSEIAPEQMQTLRKLVESPVHVQPHPFLEQGDHVRILRGPFEGLHGILTRVKNQYRVVISVDLLRKSAAVEIDIADLLRLSPAGKSFTGRAVSSPVFETSVRGLAAPHGSPELCEGTKYAE